MWVGILIFWGFNLIFWRKMKQAFHMDGINTIITYEKDGKRGNKYLFMLKNAFDIFIYTVLIFFSFRLDTGKINFRQTRFVIAFLFQYFYGIICTAFAIRALFDAI
jgi:hypothetical protein